MFFYQSKRQQKQCLFICLFALDKNKSSECKFENGQWTILPANTTLPMVH